METCYSYICYYFKYYTCKPMILLDDDDDDDVDYMIR